MLGQGIGQKLAQMTLEEGFQEMGLREIYLIVWKNNLRARGLYERIGFQHSGDCRKEICRMMVDLFEMILDKDAFEEDELIQNWIVHHLQVIGEAARSLSGCERRNQRYTMGKDHRNATYPGSSLLQEDLVWSVVVGDLPELKQRIEAILEAEQEE